MSLQAQEKGGVAIGISAGSELGSGSLGSGVAVEGEAGDSQGLCTWCLKTFLLGAAETEVPQQSEL